MPCFHTRAQRECPLKVCHSQNTHLSSEIDRIPPLNSMDCPADCFYYGTLENHNNCPHSILPNTTVKEDQNKVLRCPGIKQGFASKGAAYSRIHIARVVIKRPLHNVDADVEIILLTCPRANDCRNNIILNTIVHATFLQYS